MEAALQSAQQDTWAELGCSYKGMAARLMERIVELDGFH